MKILLWAGLGIAALYLLIVIPAGLALLIRERRFRKSPDHEVVQSIIHEYQEMLGRREDSILEILQRGRREVVKRNGVQYSVDVTAKKLNIPRSYNVVVSVGRINPISVGHAASTTVSFS